MARLVGQLGQLRQPMRRRQQGDPPTLQAPTAEALVGGDDALGEVGIDERGIDEFLVQRTDARVGEVVHTVQPPGLAIECHVPAMAVEEAEDRTQRIGRQLGVFPHQRSARSRQAAGSSGKARLRIAVGDSQDAPARLQPPACAPVAVDAARRRSAPTHRRPPAVRVRPGAGSPRPGGNRQAVSRGGKTAAVPQTPAAPAPPGSPPDAPGVARRPRAAAPPRPRAARKLEHPAPSDLHRRGMPARGQDGERGVRQFRQAATIARRYSSRARGSFTDDSARPSPRSPRTVPAAPLPGRSLRWRPRATALRRHRSLRAERRRSAVRRRRRAPARRGTCP